MEVTTAMRSWITEVIPDAGVIEVARAMPWAVVATVSCDDGIRWFKANHSTFAYEAALISELDRLAPGMVVAPIARHIEAGWFVMHDGGDPATAGDLDAMVTTYTALQNAVEPHHDVLFAAGAPDLRPHRLGALYERAAADPDASVLGDRLRTCRPRFDQICERLAADGRATIVNTDMKISHAFAGPPVRLFDWGDAVVTHPLIGLASLRHNIARDGAHLMSDLPLHDLAASELEDDAARIAPLLTAAVWLRDPPGTRDRFPGAIERHLRELVRRLDPAG